MVTVKNFLKTHFWSNGIMFYEKFLIVKLTEVTDNFFKFPGSILFLSNLMKTMCVLESQMFSDLERN